MISRKQETTIHPVLPGIVHFGRDICADLHQAERREWWLANGLGGYAGGTVAGTLTRRYHGLLIAPVPPSGERTLILAKADATLIDGDRMWPLFANRWERDVIDPQGHLGIESFHLDGRMPVWRFACGGLRLQQCIWMEPRAHTTCIAFRLLAPVAITEPAPQLRITLLVNGRNHHGNTPPGALDLDVERRGEARLRVRPRGGYDLHLHACNGCIEPDHSWYERFDLIAERARGLPAVDAHLCVGEAVLTLHPGQWCGVSATLHEPAPFDPEMAIERHQARDRTLLRRSRLRKPSMVEPPEWIDQLLLAADSFLIRRLTPERADGLSVIAGYPWFDEWGRDAMIALPGLTLATGRSEAAMRLLDVYGRCIRHGLLANTLAAGGHEASDNSADAALWFIEAWRASAECISDHSALQKAFPLLQEIIDRHIEGTRHGIGVDPNDRLLRAGEPGLQVTWMDAKVDEWVVTPRIGKPVEINALWYNALCAMHSLAQRLKLDGSRYRHEADAVRSSFQRFVNPANGALFDVLDGPEGTDATVRPNQILAVSLPFSPLDRAAQSAVVDLCRTTLLTSYGLRSLSPSDPRYQACYRGDVVERDGAYHQGTVWGWLLGHYAMAEFRVHGHADAALAWLEPVRDHLLDAGLGTVSEIFDGDPPHTPRGCPAQAWSVACVLEAWWRLRSSPPPRPITGNEDNRSTSNDKRERNDDER